MKHRHCYKKNSFQGLDTRSALSFCEDLILLVKCGTRICHLRRRPFIPHCAQVPLYLTDQTYVYSANPSAMILLLTDAATGTVSHQVVDNDVQRFSQRKF